MARYDVSFVDALSQLCSAEGFPAGTLGGAEKGLDHGSSIPMRFINEAYDSSAEGGTESGAVGGTESGSKGSLTTHPKYIVTGVSGLSFAEHYRFGQLIARTSERLGRKTIVIASGDLSHKLKDEGPYGFAPEGPEFDRIVCSIAGDADFARLLDMDGAFLEKAGECGHRPLVVMAGALDRKAVAAKLHSYEGPFGVGYCIASFLVTGRDEGRNFLDKYLDKEIARAAERAETESPHVALARKTVESYVKTRRLYEVSEPLPENLACERAGVFVSIKKQGQLRGCIGTISPVTECIGEEIRANAISAATRDSRFDEIGADELPYLEYSVDVLAPAEPVDG
jgi:hypothetical protein